ncbi:hypothetical protein BDV93DRAFT_510899 [Ceratobasidium sp. AG-I]|nr:hypothetical protein BDV93DRAFT_510899 [Ceratobasidium sp. AG-I]
MCGATSPDHPSTQPGQFTVGLYTQLFFAGNQYHRKAYSSQQWLTLFTAACTLSGSPLTGDASPTREKVAISNFYHLTLLAYMRTSDHNKAHSKINVAYKPEKGAYVLQFAESRKYLTISAAEDKQYHLGPALERMYPSWAIEMQCLTKGTWSADHDGIAECYVTFHCENIAAIAAQMLFRSLIDPCVNEIQVFPEDFRVHRITTITNDDDYLIKLYLANKVGGYIQTNPLSHISSNAVPPKVSDSFSTALAGSWSTPEGVFASSPDPGHALVGAQRPSCQKECGVRRKEWNASFWDSVARHPRCGVLDVSM